MNEIKMNIIKLKYVFSIKYVNYIYADTNYIINY